MSTKGTIWNDGHSGTDGEQPSPEPTRCSLRPASLVHALVSVVGREHFTTPNNNRRKQGRRRAPPKPGAEHTAPTAENFAALQIVRAMKVSNNKYINSTYAAINGSFTLTSPSLTLLNGVAQGTSENTRIGRMTKNLWLDLDFQIDCVGFASTATVRAMVVAESTALGSALAPSQFFVDAANFAPWSQRDRTNRNASRYCVLWDSKPFVIGGEPVASGLTAPVAVGAGQPAVKPFSIHLPLGFYTDYSRGNAGTVADIDTNSIYLMITTDYSNTNTIFAAGAWTLCFTDTKE